MSYLDRLLASTAPAADPLDDRYYSTGGPMISSLAGVTLTRETSLNQATFYRCISILANTMASLPLGFYKKADKKRTELADDPIARSFAAPNPWMSSFEWRRRMWVDIKLQGEAFNQIVDQPDGTFWLVPLDPSRVAGPKKEGDIRVFVYTGDNGRPVPLVEGSDVWHITALSGSGDRGLGLIDAARNTLGISISAERHAAQFFRRGVKASGVLEHPNRLKKETAAAMSASFGALYGGVEGAGKTPVLWDGMKFNPLTMTHEQAQFIETYKEGAIGIATFCGIPPFMVGQTEKSTSWGTGIEEQGHQLVTYTFTPDGTNFESSAYRMFVAESKDPSRYFRHNLNALLRGKTMERFQVYALGVTNHILTPNDCREKEDMDPIEGGDEFPAVPGAKNGTEADPTASPVPGGQKKAETVAGVLASIFLRAEASELAPLFAANANGKKLSDAVGGYYGRHAVDVAGSLDVSKESAAAYCKEQQKAALEAGGAGLETWVETHKARVVALILGRDIA